MKNLITPKRSIIFPLLIALTSWALLGLLIVFVNPEILQPLWYAPFWILAWIAVTWTISLLLGTITRGVMYGTAALIFLVLRFLDLGNMLNGFLIAGLVVAIDIGISKFAHRSS